MCLLYLYFLHLLFQILCSKEKKSREENTEEFESAVLVSNICEP